MLQEAPHPSATAARARATKPFPPRSIASGREGSPLQPAAHGLDAGAVALDDVADVPHLVELGLELVDLPQQVAHARDLGVGAGRGGRGAVRLGAGGARGLVGELRSAGRQRCHSRGTGDDGGHGRQHKG